MSHLTFRDLLSLAMLTVVVLDAGMKSGLYKPLIGRVVFVPGSEFGVDVPELYYKGVFSVLFSAPLKDSLSVHDECCDISMLHSTATWNAEIRIRHETSCHGRCRIFSRVCFAQHE